MIEPEAAAADGSTAEPDPLAADDAAADSPDPDAEPQAPDEEPTDVEAADPADPLAVAEADRDGYLDDLRRVTADFANFRKQVDKRSTEVRANAATGLVEKLLPVLDACDAAVLQGATDVDPIRAALLEALAKEGLEQHDPAGEPFDPEHHEAVMTEPGDGDPVVTEVLRTGYAWNGRILRPAMVKVRG